MPRRMHRIALAAAAAAVFVLPVLPGNPAAAAPCPYSGTHYWARVWSGYGSNKGTGAEMDTWTHWSLNGHPRSDSPFSNEAVWTMTGTSYTNANTSEMLEVGFITGLAYEGTFSNGMYPYYTTYDGDCNNGCGYFTSTNLPTGTVIWNSATDNGTDSWAYVNSKLIGEFYNPIPTPRLNYEQAEVDYHDIWMGGGSGASSALEYQNSSNEWLDWGSITGVMSPTGTDGASYYGYYEDLEQPNGVTQGGYGSSAGC
jgi:hypothetical protein